LLGFYGLLAFYAMRSCCVLDTYVALNLTLVIVIVTVV